MKQFESESGIRVCSQDPGSWTSDKSSDSVVKTLSYHVCVWSRLSRTLSAHIAKSLLLASNIIKQTWFYTFYKYTSISSQILSNIILNTSAMIFIKHWKCLWLLSYCPCKCWIIWINPMKPCKLLCIIHAKERKPWSKSGQRKNFDKTNLEDRLSSTNIKLYCKNCI